MPVILLPPAVAFPPPQPDSALTPAAQPQARRCTPEQWAQDLDQIAAELPAKHKNFFHRLTKEEWERRLARLREELPGLSEPATVLAVAKLCAVADAHTQLQSSPYFRARPSFPIAFLNVKEGRVLVSAPEEHADLLGSLLVAVGGTPSAEVVERLSAFYPWENAPSRLLFLSGWITRPDAFVAAGLSRGVELAEFTFRTPAGAERTVEIRSVAPADQRGARPKLAPFKVAPAGLGAVTATNDPKALWHAMLPGLPVLYVRYNRCADDKDATVADYAKAVLARLDEGGVERVVIDLRFNGGGNSALLDPFIRELAGRERLRKKGAVVVLTGAGTFSSAQLNASSLRKKCGAVVIGGPTGQKPNTYGEMKSFTLANSKLQVSYSTKLFRTEEGDPDSMTPDEAVEATQADLLAGRDAVLEAAAAYKAE